MNLYAKTCKECGKEFFTRKKPTRLCSNACRKARKVKQDKEYSKHRCREMLESPEVWPETCGFKYNPHEHELRLAKDFAAGAERFWAKRGQSVPKSHKQEINADFYNYASRHNRWDR